MNSGIRGEILAADYLGHGAELSLIFKRRIKSHLTFAGFIRSSQYSTRFQDKG